MTKRAADAEPTTIKAPMSRAEQVGEDTDGNAVTDLYYFYIEKPEYFTGVTGDIRLKASFVRRIQPEPMCALMRNWLHSQRLGPPEENMVHYTLLRKWQDSSYTINGAYRSIVRTPEQQQIVEEFNKAITMLALPRNEFARGGWIMYRGENGKGEFSLYRIAMRSKATGKAEMTRRPYSLTWHLGAATRFSTAESVVGRAEYDNIIVVLHHMPYSPAMNCVYMPALDAYAGKGNDFTMECEFVVQAGVYLQYVAEERGVRMVVSEIDTITSMEEAPVYTFVHIAIVAAPPPELVRYDATLRHLCTRCTDREVLATHISEEGLHAVCDDHRLA